MSKEVEQGWLIESRDNGAVVWLCVSNGWFFWTQNSSDSLRFSRKEDAERMATTHCVVAPGGNIGSVVATFHIWEEAFDDLEKANKAPFWPHKFYGAAI